nr:MAG TPA: hypothetical protein [Inoviridae sp.]DAU43072.1 MAG TPA: hypothetical protein [Inoviridae sp.]
MAPENRFSKCRHGFGSVNVRVITGFTLVHGSMSLVLAPRQ